MNLPQKKTKESTKLYKELNYNKLNFNHNKEK